MADRAGAAVHEHRQPLDRAVGVQQPVRGDERDAEPGAEVEAGAVGQADDLRGREGDVLRRAAAAALPLRVVGPDALADAGRVDALADGLDLPRPVLVRRDRLVRGRAVEPFAGLPVRRVDAGDADADEHLARAWLGLVDLPDGQPPGVGALGRVLGGEHQAATRANTRVGLPVPSTSRSGATTISAPVGGRSARLASCVRP